jgi:hypothetical protein
MTDAISGKADETVMLLVAWELLGRRDVDPKELLRNMEMEDLLFVRNSIRAAGVGDEFITTQMVVVEVMYRNGLLTKDWRYTRDGDHVQLEYTPVRKDRMPSMLSLVSSGGVC